jgi:hypothetical protein
MNANQNSIESLIQVQEVNFPEENRAQVMKDIIHGPYNTSNLANSIQNLKCYI